ncbi:MAG TPA: UvrD-helicase domain-containing protein [Polyangia bacterium]|jgi:exodeoxyribonuclease V beta subunit|nr:UvrD-helicase domain-containing protein [Polyangia bacterium]
MAQSPSEAPTVRFYPKPDELAALATGASAVIEASAGTGKTYLLEHLVLDRLIETDLGLESILIVTFTEKATGDLISRLRAAIDRLLAFAGAPAARDEDATPADSARYWRLDDTARSRLLRARQSFDRATISTMHGFCQGVLTENAFISNRLFAQQHVDSRQTFGLVFKDVLRRTLSTDATYRRYLSAWLRARSVDDLEQLLYDARRTACPFGVAFDPRRIVNAAAAFVAAADDPALGAAMTKHAGHAGTSKAMLSRTQILAALCRQLEGDDDVPTFLQQLDETLRRLPEVFRYLEEKLGTRPTVSTGPLRPFQQAFLALADAAVPLDVAVATLFAPAVTQQLEQHKRQAGLFDFDDMLALVAESLEGPHGPALIAALRDRYKIAFIDEFQDTDPVQWRIFKRLFFDSGGENPLIVIGDPKQSIYGFRGADVQTYLAARSAVAGDRGPAVRLQRNFRSVPAVVDAFNAILDQAADPAFFSGAIGYEHPVVSGVPGGGDAGGHQDPAVTLLSVTSTTGDTMKARDVKRTLADRIAAEIAALLAGPAAPPASEIFVLTRTTAEADAIGQVLREAGLPHAFFKQDGLYQTPEACHVRDLLAAVADPNDRSKRAKAWLTPFFGLTLDDLPACAGVTADHPLLARLFTWKALADDGDYRGLYDRILDDSGVVRRELFSATNERRLTNYLHLCELLLAQTARARPTLAQVVRNLGSYIDKLRAPSVEEGNIQRRESDRDAVQIMTMHKAKGLEADVVFLYGGFSGWRSLRRVRAYSDRGQRLSYVGRTRRIHLEDRLKAEQAEEDQRLLYVALTRARRRLYLPYFGILGEGDELYEGTKGEDEVWSKLHGGYRHVNRRLRAVLAATAGPERHLFAVTRVPCPPEAADTGPPARASARPALADWRPPPQLLGGDDDTRALALDELRRRHAGLVITSYSRLKRAHGGYQPPAELVDAIDAALDGGGDESGTGATTLSAAQRPEDAPPELPGGALSGIFLHAVLESVPLQTLANAPTLEAWCALPAIRDLFATTMRRTDRDPRFLGDAQQLVYRALTTPIPLSATHTLPGIARADAVLRETEFVYPTDAASRGFVKGFIDLIFEDEGRVYVADWKSDFLPSWDADAVAVHVANNYALQARLYALALVKMLGITGREQYQARFGGLVFVFLRGLPEGLLIQRPSYDDVQSWQRDLAEQPL